jgi:hypothetical protein
VEGISKVALKEDKQHKKETGRGETRIFFFFFFAVLEFELRAC